MSQRTNTPTQHATQQVQLLDPRTLLVDVNVRLSERVEEDFVASVRELGVLQPVVAVRTATGHVRVRYGHRRTRAAVEAALPVVPVLVVADEASDDDAEVERLVGQFAENEHRANLSTGEKVAVMAQLAAFGVPPAQIAQRTKVKQAAVEAALSISTSRLAAAATERYDLTLDQAAVLAEFEEDTETVTALVAATRTGQFDHVAQRARDARTEAAQRAQASADLEAAGVQVIDHPSYDSPIRALRRLTHDGQPMTPQSHATCPGHAAYLDTQWVHPQAQAGEDVDDDLDADDVRQMPVRTLAALYVCTDPRGYAHTDTWAGSTGTARTRMADLDPAAREAARAERRDVVESNRAWGSAQTVRRAWLRAFLTRKTPPKGAATLVATALAREPETVTRIGANHLAVDLLGLGEISSYGRAATLTAAIQTASEARAGVLTLAQVLAGYEDGTHTGSWRRVDPATRAYLQFLTSCGYELSAVERRACGLAPLPTEASTDAPGQQQASAPGAGQISPDSCGQESGV